MARKRKIPVRKHHGIRDPLKQLEEKEQKLKGVVNNPPERGNDQKLSFNFEQFKKLADNAKAGKKLKRMHRGQEDKPSEQKNNTNKSTQAKNKSRNIKQFVDETDVDYLRRVNRITSESLREAQYEAKYGVNVVHDPKTGAITVKKRPKNELDELLKQKLKEKRNGKVGKKSKGNQPRNLIDPKLAKELIKQAIKEDKEENKKETADLQEFKRDDVKFGEVVHAPPTLLTLPRKATKNETVPRPGKKNNLLLRSLIQENSINISDSGSTKPTDKSLMTSVTKTQLKGKRKYLPAATRSMLESEQIKLIELYRQLKKSKEKPASHTIKGTHP